MLKRVGHPVDEKGAAVAIKDATFPVPFAPGLEFNSPVHGNWNIVHTGMLMPEVRQIYVCADNCMRGVVLTAAEMNAADRFSFVIVKEENLLNGNLEDITIEGVTDVLNKNRKHFFYLPSVCIIFWDAIWNGCIRNWRRGSRRLRLSAVIWIRSCRSMDLHRIRS